MGNAASTWIAVRVHLIGIRKNVVRDYPRELRKTLANSNLNRIPVHPTYHHQK
jgi:hypothetical protein